MRIFKTLPLLFIEALAFILLGAGHHKLMAQGDSNSIVNQSYAYSYNEILLDAGSAKIEGHSADYTSKRIFGGGFTLIRWYYLSSSQTAKKLSKKIDHHFSFGIGLGLALQGGLWNNESYNERDRLLYLQMPAMIRYHKIFAKGDAFFGGAGFYYGAALSAKYKDYGGKSAKGSLTLGNDWSNSDYRKADAGLKLTIGYKLKVPVMIGLDMNIGLHSVQPSTGAPQDSKEANRFTGVQIGYVFR